MMSARSTSKSSSKTSNRLKPEGLETVVDPITRRDLNNTKEDIKKSKLKIWVSLSIAVLALALIIAACISLIM